jgi:hypothetical protein
MPKEKKPHHVSELVIKVKVETSYDQAPESKCALLLNAARVIDKQYTCSVRDLGLVERNS